MSRPHAPSNHGPLSHKVTCYSSYIVTLEGLNLTSHTFAFEETNHTQIDMPFACDEQLVNGSVSDFGDILCEWSMQAGISGGELLKCHLRAGSEIDILTYLTS